MYSSLLSLFITILQFSIIITFQIFWSPLCQYFCKLCYKETFLLCFRNFLSKQSHRSTYYYSCSNIISLSFSTSLAVTINVNFSDFCQNFSQYFHNICYKETFTTCDYIFLSKKLHLLTPYSAWSKNLSHFSFSISIYVPIYVSFSDFNETLITILSTISTQKL